MPHAHSSPQQTGKVSKWNSEKGYGWLQWQGEEVFLHIRDFDGGGREPGIGEALRFTMGQDDQGRPCATKAVSFRPKWLRMPSRSILGLMGLLILPVLALYHLSFSILGIGIYSVCLSLVTYTAYASDKRRAQTNAWRIPELYLHGLEIVGGWPGAWMAQRRLRHKSSKLSYQVKFWLIIVIHQFLALDSMMDWQLSRSLVGAT